MPIHDWTRVPAGLFHDFHQSWSIRIKDELNRGRLPKGVAALVEQKTGPREADVLAIEDSTFRGIPGPNNGNVATLARPVTRIMQRTSEAYARKANRIAIKHHLGKTIAVIEIISPGNKDSRVAFREFVEKSVTYLRSGIHVLIADLFPPGKRDPVGIHKAIWDEIVDRDEDVTLPTGKDRTLVSYETSDAFQAFVEPIGVGDALPDMPLFLYKDYHVAVPLETTYMAAWEASPEMLRQAVETGVVSNPDADQD